MTTHARLSPSKAHRWMKCPGSIREEAKYPDLTNEYAIDGTHSHTLLQQCIDGKKSPFEIVGISLTDKEGSFIVDKGRAERVNIAIKYIEDKQGEIFSESPVSLSVITGRNDLFGTVDIKIISDDCIEIVDYKDGVKIVEAVENPQLFVYALGTIQEFGSRPRIRMTIIQPMSVLNGVNPIRSWELTMYEFNERVPGLVDAANATDSIDAPLIPGNSQCMYCKAKGNCQALVEDITAKMVGVDPLRDANRLTNQQIQEMLDVAPILRQLLESVEDEAANRMKKGEVVPGYKLVNGRGSQKWAMTDEEMIPRLKKMGIPKDEITVSKIISPSQAKKLSWAKKDGTVKSLSERQLKQLETDYIVKGMGKLTVVPDSDSRPSVVENIEALFKPVIEELPEWLQPKKGEI